MKQTQHTKIVNYLVRHPEGLTTYEAFTELGITKLTTRIGELIREGYVFDKIKETSLNRDGEVVTFNRYKIHLEEI